MFIVYKMYEIKELIVIVGNGNKRNENGNEIINALLVVNLMVNSKENKHIGPNSRKRFQLYHGTKPWTMQIYFINALHFKRTLPKARI